MKRGQAALDALTERTREDARDLAGAVARGMLSPREFGDRMAEVLEDAHAEATVIGRHHGGDTAPPDADDRRFGELVVDGESEFLARFVADLESGRYTDEAGDLDAEKIGRRAELYAGRLTGTANEALALTAERETLWRWVLGATEHCPDCPRLAAAGPYTAETLPTHPGANATACMGNCTCHLEAESGVRGFAARWNPLTIAKA